MEEKKNLLTYAGLKKLEEELHDLKVVKRKEVAGKIKEAREQGDLSENAEYDAAKDEYRLLRKPSSAETITGYYNGKKCSLVTEGKMEQGKYKRFVVDGGHREKKHHLQVGDFYYADGNIVSVTDENPPVKGCIGVVYYVGKTFPSELYEGEYGDMTKDALKRDYPACNHAFVVALTDGEDERIYWETEKKSIEFGKWFETLSLQSSFFNVQIADYGIPSKFEKMLGYNNTKVIETIVKQAPGSEYINIGSLQGYRDNCLLPEMTTNMQRNKLMRFLV